MLSLEREDSFLSDEDYISFLASLNAPSSPAEPSSLEALSRL